MKNSSKKTVAKKALPKKQMGGNEIADIKRQDSLYGPSSGRLGFLPSFEQRQRRKIERAKTRAAVAAIEGEGSVGMKRDSRANRIATMRGKSSDTKKTGGMVKSKKK